MSVDTPNFGSSGKKIISHSIFEPSRQDLEQNQLHASLFPTRGVDQQFQYLQYISFALVITYVRAKYTNALDILNFAYLEHVFGEFGPFLVFLLLHIFYTIFVPCDTVQKSKIIDIFCTGIDSIINNFFSIYVELSSLFLSTYSKHVGLCTKFTRLVLVLFLRVSQKKRYQTIFFNDQFCILSVLKRKHSEIFR